MVRLILPWVTHSPLMALIFVLTTSSLTPAQSTQRDTLRYLNRSAPLTAYTYPIDDYWKYYTGHNTYFREEYAEKYTLKGKAMIIGVISHHQGEVNPDQDHDSEFNVFAVSPNHLPGTLLGGKAVPYKKLDLSGKPMTTLFDSAIAVVDSFFISFNLTDYAHGGFGGNNIALLTGLDGTRDPADLVNFGRNALRLHNHEIRQWRDFYSQNFTPVAVHFALYPIVSFRSTVLGIDEPITREGTQFFPAYPNPATPSTLLTVPYALRETTQLTVTLRDLQGRLIWTADQGKQPPGKHITTVPLSSVSAGTYLLVCQTDGFTIAQKLVVH